VQRPLFPAALKGRIMRSANEPDLFTLGETAILSRVGEDRIRREIDFGLIEAAKTEEEGAAERLFFDEPEILYLSLLGTSLGMIKLTREGRRRAAWLLKHSSPRRLLQLAPPLNDREGVVVKDADCWALIHSDQAARRRWIDRVRDEWARSVSDVVALDWRG
ncbi:MAG: hypothetical protein ACREFQ_22435, partial [Stellaceae bacterium]